MLPLCNGSVVFYPVEKFRNPTVDKKLREFFNSKFFYRV